MSERIQHQFWLLAEVRWHILRNSLRLKGRKLELVGQIFALVSGVAVSLLLGTALGGATYFLLIQGRTQIIPILLEVIFGAWLLGPLLIEGSSPTLDFREIARYPVSFRLYYLLNVSYGLLDPWALLCLVWLGCIWVGTALARPHWAFPATFWFVIFASLNLLFNRALFGLLEPMMNSRRGRETLLAVLMIFLVCMQIAIYVVLPRWGKLLIPVLGRIFFLLHQTLPAGFVVRGLQGENWTDIVVALSALLGYGLLSGMILWRQLWRNYLGEISSEAPLGFHAVQMQPGWNLPFFDGSTAAIIEKELRYARRDSRVWMTCISGPLMAFIFAASSDTIKVMALAPKIRPGTILAILTGFFLISFVRQIYNLFSHDARGFQCWLMSPVDFRRVLAGKNFALGILMTGSYAAATMILVIKGGISFWQVLSVTGGYMFAALAMFTAGNFFSVIFPTKVEFGRISGGKPSVVAVLLGLVVQGSIIGSLALLFAIARVFGLDLLPIFVLPLMILLALKGYLYSLQASSNYVKIHAEDISAVLA